MAGLIDDNQEHILEEAMQEFADAQSRGQEPDIDEFVKRYPKLENQLKQRIQNLEKISDLFNCLVQVDESEFENAMVGQELVGSQIGHYKLLSILSEGGMGIVYLAEQEQPIKRRVALKVIKPGMDSKRVIARFEAERQALALMDHPNIAQVHDAGTTEAGRPYFVMEHVRGIPITEHCDRYKFTIEERLKLFLQVCEAVQHAHQKGIIHRDIKPTNILVSFEANKSVPKVIDFGVAKALSQPLTERTLVTEQGQMLGTPEYMSPEQAEMTGEDIDTRSDIYSLGVLLYELLTGVLPFESEVLRKGGISQVRKMICEEEPKTPSTRLSRLSHEKTTELTKGRRTQPVALQRQIRGDLDWITLKAMEKDRIRRYGSVGEFGADIVRHLNNEPVQAGPPGKIYKVKKFVKRNRVLVTGIATVLVVLITGVVVSTLLAIGQARARAEAQAVSDFLLNNVLRSLDLMDMRGREITVRSILDAASQGLEGKLVNEPLVEASIRWTLAGSYTCLGLYEPAELHAQRALDIRRAQLGDNHLDTLLSLYELGWLCAFQSRYEEAERLLTKALEGMKPLLNEEHPYRLGCTATLGWMYNWQGRFHGAQELFEEGLSIVYRAWGEESEHSPVYFNGLAYAYLMQGHHEEAERLSVKGLEISRRVRGDQDWETLNAMNIFGEICRELGRYDQAEQLLVKALDGTCRVRGEQHSHTLWAMNSLARLYLEQDRYEEAEQLFSKTLDGMRRVRGKGHEETLGCMNGLAVLYTKQKRYDKAESLFNEVLKGRQRKLGDEDPETLETINDLGILHRERKHYEQAEKLLNEALNGRKIKLGPYHPHTLESTHELAVLYRAQSDYDKAEPLLLEAIEGRRFKLGGTHPHTLESINNLIDLYEAWNKLEEAKKWQAKLQKIEAKTE
jgi:serine/threonine protein kinase/tetratricopeptide (TPR) repeat protein